MTTVGNTVTQPLWQTTKPSHPPVGEDCHLVAIASPIGARLRNLLEAQTVIRASKPFVRARTPEGLARSRRANWK